MLWGGRISETSINTCETKLAPWSWMVHRGHTVCKRQGTKWRCKSYSNPQVAARNRPLQNAIANCCTRALPTETKVESGTSPSKSGISVDSSKSGKRAGTHTRAFHKRFAELYKRIYPGYLLLLDYTQAQSWLIQKSLSLRCEPSSWPLHIYTTQLFLIWDTSDPLQRIPRFLPTRFSIYTQVYLSFFVTLRPKIEW
jgi:hypothetical protein